MEYTKLDELRDRYKEACHAGRLDDVAELWVQIQEMLSNPPKSARSPSISHYPKGDE